MSSNLDCLIGGGVRVGAPDLITIDLAVALLDGKSVGLFTSEAKTGRLLQGLASSAVASVPPRLLRLLHRPGCDPDEGCPTNAAGTPDARQYRRPNMAV